MKTGLLQGLIFAGGAYVAYVLYREYKKATVYEAQQPVPPEAKLTGKVQQTRGSKPGLEVLGFKIQDWAEIQFPTGEKDWIRIKPTEKLKKVVGNVLPQG